MTEPPDRCQTCGDVIPEDDEVVAPWACTCGRWKLLDQAGQYVHMVKQNLRVCLDYHAVLGSAGLLVAGMEWWAVKRALAEEPELIRTIVCPN